MSIIVYSKPQCPYCDKAKALLTRLGHDYTEKVVTVDMTLENLYEVLGKQVRTIPQIVIDDVHIGGYNELVEHYVSEGVINFKGERVSNETN